MPLVWKVFVIAQLAGAPVARSESPQTVYQGTVLPLLEKHCFECHSGEAPEGGLALDAMRSLESFEFKREHWRKVARNVRGRVMPPEDASRLSEDEIRAIVDFVSAELARRDCTGEVDPGRVTLRRLNRSEYNNTIRDLLGIELRPADNFPEDDAGYGFDNIGDVLTLPPVLLERYLAAAEEIAQAAIRAEDPHRQRRWTFAARELRSTLSKEPADGDVVVLDQDGEAAAYIDAPAEGVYRVRARVVAHQAGPDPVKAALRFDRDFVRQVVINDTTGREQDLEAEVRAAPGRRRFAVSFRNGFRDPKATEPSGSVRKLEVASIEIVGPIGLSPASPPGPHRRILPHRPIGKYRRVVLKEALERLASRAYRRPATEEEVDRLIGLVDLAESRGETPEGGVQLALKAILVSPHFLFHVETQAERPSLHTESLSDYPLASRLSYFLWSSMPDEELFELSRQGILRDGRVLARQVRRMLADPKARSLAENFGGQWLETRRLAFLTPDPGRFPGYDPPLVRAMRAETEHFFWEIVRDDRSIVDFLEGDFTYVNERLAKHYGIQDVQGKEFRRVSLAKTPRRGVLTQASVLTATSNPTRTSPVKRGKWILENILGTPPPPPPPDVPELKEEQGALSGTLRQKMEQHRSSPSCASCHSRMDPLGFGMENFDAIGGWRDKDGGATIDASGVLPGGERFDGPTGLIQVLSTKKELFRRCLTEKLLTYALGRGLEEPDQCVVDRITERVASDGDRFGRLILEVVLSEPFRRRRLEVAQ